MADKKLNVRVSLKYDTYANWYDKNPVLLAGEAAIATVPATIANETGDNGLPVNPPTVLIKIGDGTSTYRELAFISAKAADVIEACKSQDGLTAFVNNIINGADFANNEAIKNLQDAVDVLNGEDTEEGSVAKAIKDAIDALDLANTYAEKEHEHTVSEITDFDDKVKAYNYATKTEAQGYADAKDEAIAAAKKAGDDAMAEAAKRVELIYSDDTLNVTGDTSVMLEVKLSSDDDNALEIAADGLKVVVPDAAEYSIVKAADSGEYAAVYNLTKDGEIVGASINIPKDLVVKSGSVVGEEIILVLNDEENTEIKIPVGSLIEYVTSGSQAGDMVVIAVDETTHKVTATITDGTITAAKLTTELQTAIGKAHSHDNADVLAGIDADKVAAWDAAEQNAKDYADELDEAMAERVAALEEIDHDHANKALLDTYTQTEEDLADAVAKKHEHANATVLDGIEAEDVAAWDAKVDGVAAVADSGLKATREGNAIAIDFDETVTFIFDCGNAEVPAAE